MENKTIKNILLGINFICFVPLISFSLFFVLDKNDPLSKISFIILCASGVYTLVFVIFIILYALIKGSKKEQAISNLPKRTEHTVYHATATIFEETKFIGLNRGLVVISIIFMAPLLLIFISACFTAIAGMDMDWTFFVFSILLFFITNIFLPIGLKKIKQTYKAYLYCPQQYRHEVPVEFDLNTTGKVYSKFFFGDYEFKYLGVSGDTVQYNENTKTLVIRWGGSYKIKYSRYSGGNLVIALPKQQSEELYRLLKENNVTIQELSSENAYYILRTLGEDIEKDNGYSAI